MIATYGPEVAAMLIYFLGCLAIGAASGILIGASSSPVVGVALPLLFALLGGAAGIVGLLPSNPRSQVARVRFRIVGAASLCVSVSLLLGSAYGIMLKTGRGLDYFLLQRSTPAFLRAPLPKESDNLDGQDLVRLLLLDSNLAVRGVSRDDRSMALTRLVQSKMAANEAYGERRPNLVQAVRSILDKTAKDYPEARAFLAAAQSRRGWADIAEVRALAGLWKLVASEDYLKDTSIEPQPKELFSSTLDAVPSLGLLSDELNAQIEKLPPPAATASANPLVEPPAIAITVPDNGM
jgi:hypothetical protein